MAYRGGSTFIRDFLQPWHLLLLLFPVVMIVAIVLIIRAVSRSGKHQQPQQGRYPPTPFRGQPPTQYQSSAPPENDPATTLAQAKTMLDLGLISQVEFDDTKRYVLAKMRR